MKRNKYAPRKKTADILNWVLAKVEAVPYQVTVRWAFYQCVQELGLQKHDYSNFKHWLSRARKTFWNGWAPWLLIDDTRDLIKLGNGFDSFEDWVEEVKNIKPKYEKFSTQDNLMMIWFEAEAMRSQFMYYAAPYYVPMAPFRGDPGIEYKWRIAKFLDKLDEEFGPKPIIILYFGDYETDKETGSRAKGFTIPLDALKDIRPWFYELQLRRGVKEANLTTLDFKRCGLNENHIEEWDLPMNPERPGEYQWEALSDSRAGNLITDSIKNYWKMGPIQEIEKREKEDQERWKTFIDDNWPGD